MKFYSFQMPGVHAWVGWAVGSSMLLLGYVAVDTMRSRRGAVPVFNSALVQQSEEQARYPCAALKGLDVVVRNYYVAEDEGDRRRRERSRQDVVFLSDAEKAEAIHQQRNRSLFSLDRLRQALAMFSNETNNPNSGTLLDGRRVLSEKDDLSQVRIIVDHGRGRDGEVTRRSASAVSPGSLQFVHDIEPHSAAASGATLAEEKQHQRQQVEPAAETPQPFVASSSWPPHTEKYCAVILEPSRARGGNGQEGVQNASLSAHLRDPLRWLADSATHQSLIRCRGRSALVHMNCDADPTYLGAAYLRVMLSAFLLLPSVAGSSANNSQPLRVAVLGVAGGSLPNFLHHYFPSVIKVMDMVDIESNCFRAAQEQLGMGRLMETGASSPEEVRAGSTTHVRVHVSDAAAFLEENQRQMKRSRDVRAVMTSPKGTRPVFAPPTRENAIFTGKLTRPYDVLFVDTFVGSELASEVTDTEFVHLCRQSLTSFGVVAFNLPERNRAFVDTCERVFGKLNVYTIPTPGTSNTIVLARGGVEETNSNGAIGASLSSSSANRFSTSLPHLSHRTLYRRAEQLQSTYKLPYDLANHFPVWWRFW